MKIKALNIIIPLIFIVGFNVCWFTLIEVHSTTRWICYTAIHVAYLLLWVSMCFIPETKGGIVYGYPRISVALSFFFSTLITGIVIAAINPDSVVWRIITIAGYLAIYAILMKAEAHSIASDNQDAKHLYFIRDCSEQLQETMRQIADVRQRKQVEQVYDAIRNAQVTSVPQAVAAETQIMSKIAEIQIAVSDAGRQQSVIKEALALIHRRDSLIRQFR